MIGPFFNIDVIFTQLNVKESVSFKNTLLLEHIHFLIYLLS